MAHTKKIPGVPDSIERSAYIALIESLGLNSKDLTSLTFGHSFITAEVYAKDGAGHIMVDLVDNCAVKHRISIPISDPDSTPAFKEMDSQWTTIPGVDGPVVVRAD